MNSLLLWLKGAFAAALGGGLAGATQVGAQYLQGGQINGKQVGAAATTGAVIALLAYWKQPPSK